MCQLCQLGAIKDRDKWPTKCIFSAKALGNAVGTAHRLATQYETELTASLRLPKSDPAHGMADKLPMLNSARAIFTLLDRLDAARREWWADNSERRRAWQEADDSKKLTLVNLANNKAKDMIADMEVVVGRYCTYALTVEVGSVRDGTAADEWEIAKLEKGLKTKTTTTTTTTTKTK